MIPSDYQTEVLQQVKLLQV